ncbi:hypothetical protein ACIOHE_00750 [Streptomyces sp. NPDC087851]|uniref:hypothetical protein n=1 Tax=Streptomyces sp. NPDC087851 TaxID=3365810 RepID=UPI003807E807
MSRPKVLLTGVAPTTAGLARLSRLDRHTPYVTGVASPMVLVGARQGPAPAPKTAGDVDGVASADPGAALTGSAVLLALAAPAVVTLIVPSRATRTERSL